MSVFKEIKLADGSGTTTFYRLSQDKSTVETTSTATTETMIDYNSALNKPSINSVPLVGNKTLNDLGIQPAGDYALNDDIPTKVSQLDNDSDYATKAYVIEQISGAEHFHREIVDVLPEVGKDNVLYLLKKTGKQGDFYDEYLWIGTSYEYIGTTSTDLTDYYKKSEVDTLLNKKVDKVANKGLSTNDYTTDEKTKLASLENYNDSGLWNAVNALHNYDDTEVKASIAALNTQMEGANSELEELEEKIEYQITLIRLIKQGDTWVWENSKDDILTFQQAFDELGKSEVLLCLENIESDGKVYPSFYNAEDTYVKVLYVDKESQIHLLEINESEINDTVLGEDVIYQDKVSSTSDLPSNATKGEIRLVGSDDLAYLYDGTKWIAIDKGGSIDLSNYLAKDNTIAFNPTGNYNPATKKYVDDKVGNLFIPTKVSQLTNDSNFVGKNVSDLTNYYVKTKTYTKAEVDALIAGSGGGGSYTLPTASATTLGGIKVGDNLSIDENGKLSASGGNSNYFVITEDMVTVTTDDTKGTSPYSTTYGYTNITINDEYDIEWVEGSIYYFIIDTKMVVNGAYRNVRIRIGESGDWKPLYSGGSIAGGNGYFTKAYNTMCTYKTTYQSNGAVHILSDNNTTYANISQLEIDTGTSGTQRTITAKILKDNLNTKQDVLTAQTAYSAKGSATKVPQITTNTLGQVTSISEVGITVPTKVSQLTNDSGFITSSSLSSYKLVGDFAVISGTQTLAAGDGTTSKQNQWTVDFPSGYTADNCVCISYGGKFVETKGYAYGYNTSGSLQLVRGSTERTVTIPAATDSTKIGVEAYNISTSAKTYWYKIVLMKIS